MKTQIPAKSCLQLEERYGAFNYHPLPVVLTRGQGARVWDLDGKEYFDFLAAYSAVNQGHCHPRLLRVLQEQAAQLTLTSRAFHNDVLGPYSEYMTQRFGYQRVLPMNTGVEGGETALKLCRRWGYDRKKIPVDQAKMIFARGNFWGRTLGAISSSTDASARRGFGPFVPGYVVIPFDDLEALRQAVQDPTVAGFMVEPIQGEAGVIIPQPGYLARAAEICRAANVLMIADEVQTGLGRTGRMLASEWDEARPDILILGKALSGGILPASAVLCDDEVMLNIGPGEHGSTFGGNPLACRVAMEAVQILIDEKLPERAEILGEIFRAELAPLAAHPAVKEIRGRGLMNAVEMNSDAPISAWDICLRLMAQGVLAKPTHDHIIRFTPPLVLSDDEMRQACALIRRVFEEIV